MLLLLLLTNAFVLLPWAGAGRIIGGCEADAHSRPYMAYIKVDNGSHIIGYCGGFLIRPDAVLSAAHCVDKGTESVTVILGAHNISAQEESQQEIPAEDWVIHPEYSSDDVNNDIVLLKLKENAEINENVKCISIPKKNEHVEEGDKCSVSGWGLTSMTRNKASDVLREVELEVQNERTCQKVFHNYQRQSMICVGDEYLIKGSYEGDSGGPLVCKKKAHGIVSYGHKYCTFPQVFTRISHFEPWINKQLWRFSPKDIPCFPFSD